MSRARSCRRVMPPIVVTETLVELPSGVRLMRDTETTIVLYRPGTYQQRIVHVSYRILPAPGQPAKIREWDLPRLLAVLVEEAEAPGHHRPPHPLDALAEFNREDQMAARKDPTR